MEVHIPLGYNCGVASFLRMHKIRKFAYPFDWIISNKGTFLQLIKSKGEGFLLDENAILGKVSFDQKYDNIPGQMFTSKNIFDKGTGVLICHDYDAIKNTQYSEIRKKYKRRFDRLDEHLKQATKVTLWSRKRYSKLSDLEIYNELCERMGFDFEALCPNECSLEEIAQCIIDEYKISSIEIKIVTP